MATSPKSNSAYLAIDDALAEVKKSGNLPVPLDIRNAPTKLMKSLGYGKNYKYPHDYPNHYVSQQYLPEDIKGYTFWTPQDNDTEQKIKQRIDRLKK